MQPSQLRFYSGGKEMGLDWGMILGGFGLFMFGIKFMGDGLKAVAGDQLRDYINRFTANKISALLIGIVITIILQSSSATSALSIRLFRGMVTSTLFK